MSFLVPTQGHSPASVARCATGRSKMIAKKLIVVRRLSILAVCLAVLASADGPPGTNHRKQQSPPIKLGTSGSNVKDINSRFCCTGTLGSLVKSGTTTYILSNNHVLARSNAAALGEAIMQRGYVDTVPTCSTTGTIHVANLSKFVKINFGGTARNTVDAAIAKTISRQVSSTILDIGTVSTTTVPPALNMAVTKSGRTTGKTFGTINSLNVTVNVGGYGPCGTGTQTAKFVNQFLIGPGSFSGAGDSGSLIVKKVPAGTKPNPVGLLFAGSSTVTVANPISAVLTAFGVGFTGLPASAEELRNAMPEPADPRIDAASQVKDRYDDYLLTLPEVVGHGVGYSSSGSGVAVIQLFMRTATQEARQAAPSQIEGVPVEIVEIGEIHVIPNCGK
jgi:hypothetical protein